MFDGPEYASYIALCRELRLEREIQTGDLAVWREGGTPIFWAGPPPAPGLWTWLPRLDQWLAILEEAGVRMVGLQVSDDGTQHAAAPLSMTSAMFRECTFGDPAFAPSIEEAAARLWCAASGRAVTT